MEITALELTLTILKSVGVASAEGCLLLVDVKGRRASNL